jgi:hypothetical protein
VQHFVASQKRTICITPILKLLLSVDVCGKDTPFDRAYLRFCALASCGWNEFCLSQMLSQWSVQLSHVTRHMCLGFLRHTLPVARYPNKWNLSICC